MNIRNLCNDLSGQYPYLLQIRKSRLRVVKQRAYVTQLIRGGARNQTRVRLSAKPFHFPLCDQTTLPPLYDPSPLQAGQRFSPSLSFSLPCSLRLSLSLPVSLSLTHILTHTYTPAGTHTGSQSLPQHQGPEAREPGLRTRTRFSSLLSLSRARDLSELQLPRLSNEEKSTYLIGFVG